ncbi:hypothetical protein, unlikely [Trypanosoma brucei gambiense DAL972]|uniref:Uncharacterized protein n=1 Tax=Trypanosoma brucei gambiense (strain MHOM/CI/86/DAL972) TaxID=679716 RepID=C9ZL76_TRYB9|nr:hypothetical protein, unlikely [Trypanosoma brucei gambiense DAL972]CBH10085.1 hypothetical protein, unlikely [Trypanosoma brucei gambiense DAL972]|eukprot:XP_011772375.1 hypothetical protein, unlikely [Trypanosoma brucei gambiense DAL972]
MDQMPLIPLQSYVQNFLTSLTTSTQTLPLHSLPYPHRVPQPHYSSFSHSFSSTPPIFKVFMYMCLCVRVYVSVSIFWSFSSTSPLFSISLITPFWMVTAVTNISKRKKKEHLTLLIPVTQKTWGRNERNKTVNEEGE